MNTGIEIVTHCYSGHSPFIYEKLLFAQLSGFCTEEHYVSRVKVTVYVSENDHRTKRVAEKFSGHPLLKQNVEIEVRAVPDEFLFRRAICRNDAALKSKADVLWFTDCDYIFKEGSLETAYRESQKSAATLIFPEEIMIHREHALGDQAIDQLRHSIEYDEFIPYRVVESEFKARKESNAWGGMFIVKGHFCRESGYLKGTEWTEPLKTTEKGFLQCKCDVPFRKSCGSKEKVKIPNVYRIRHSRAGRDKGKKDHSK